MKRTARYDEYLGRFVLGVDFHDDVMFDVKRIEGRRFHPGVKYWSVPASLRAWKKLAQLDFTMLEFGGGRSYVRWLENGCCVGLGMEGPDGLFPYQKQGVMRLLTRKKMVLADDPGLGKTIQAIEWARRKQWRKLVIAPKIVLSQWEEQIHRRYLKDNEIAKVSIRSAVWETGTWNLVNYEFLPKLERVSGDFDLIVDEAHLCTNTKAARTKATLKLSDSSTRTLWLTGTMPAKPVKLWPFFLATGERQAKEFFPYALRYAGAERNDFGWDFSGATNLPELRDEITHFVLRRTKEEVLQDLPPLVLSTVRVDAKKTEKTESERIQIQKADDQLLDLLSRGHSLTSVDGIGAIQRLRVLTSKQKLPATVEYIQSLGPRKVVVFCEFRETMRLLCEALRASNPSIEAYQIHGDTDEKTRVEMMSHFKAQWLGEERAEVLILQSGVGGLGLDGLQIASAGIIHDLPWTQDQLTQIVSRLHRQGQEHDSVNMVMMLSTSHIEAKMEQGIREGKELQELLYG